MHWPQLVLYIYGILLIIGGLIGYAKAHSLPSLWAGLICGLIALFLGYDYIWHYAPICALILALVLVFLMGRRYARTRKAMPSLMIVILSIIVILVQIYVMAVDGLGNAPL